MTHRTDIAILGAAFASLALASALSIALASADGPPAPPPEAYAACASKSRGDACTVTLDDQTLEGTCEARPSDTKLSCRLSSLPPR